MVLDMMMRVTTVNNALAFYRRNARAQVYDLSTLKSALARYADDRSGNTGLALFHGDPAFLTPRARTSQTA